jgi:hypothetical protein
MDEALYDLTMHACEAASVLDPYSTRRLKGFVAVVDADALLSSIENQCRTGQRSRILRIAEARTCCAYAEDHVYGETYRGIHKMARSSPVSVNQMQRCFEEDYLPVLRWVKSSGGSTNDERVSQVIDETDVPTAEVASLIAPCLVLSGDKHLRDPGIAPAHWRDAAGYGTQIVRAAAEQEGLIIAVGIPPVAMVGGGIKLGKAVGLRPWLSVGIMLLIAYFILKDSDRRERIGNTLGPLIEGFVELMNRADAREEEAIRELKGLMFQPTAPTVKQQVATVLARSREPLLAKELHQTVEEVFISDAIPTLAEVRGTLKDSSEFVVVERYRWQLGGLAGPQ